MFENLTLFFLCYVVLTPNVTVSTVTPVEYGKKLMIVCETSPSFRVEWKHANGSQGVLHMSSVQYSFY